MTTEDLLPTSQSTPTIKLWTPRAIGFLTFFIGFPSGITLASINWIRMGRKIKALAHIIGGIVSVLALFIFPDNTGRLFGLVINVGYTIYLQQQMKADIQKINNYNIQYAHWFSGTLISLMGWGILFVVGIVVIVSQTIFDTVIPGHALYYSTRGDNYLKQGNYEQAITEYTQAIKLDPNLTSLYYNRGLAYSYKENYGLAIADYSKAIELDPEYADTYNNRCRIYYILGKYEEALPDCEKAVILAPDIDYILDLRASVYIALGRKEDAIKDFELILEISSNLEFRKHAVDELKKLIDK